MNTIFQQRKTIIIGFILLLTSVYVIKLFVLQVVDDSYKERAEHNAIREITISPPRGMIYDRNDSLIVYNEAAYDLMVIPNEVEPFDTNELCVLLDIEKEDVVKRLEKARKYSPQLPSVFEAQISKEDYGFLQEKLHKYPGFFVKNKILRTYPIPVAAHLLGYVGEVTDAQLKEDGYYQMGDNIGISGIEKSYEEELRGKKGKRLVLVDVKNREQGPYKNGEEDVTPVAGSNLWCTIDIGLQEYAEKLMSNKRGSIVAIEPSTGEILCIVSAPCYDPNLLVGKSRSKNYSALNNDSVNTPLFNRALKACYPPGSTFKLANGLIAQQEHVITSNTVYVCNGGYAIGNHTIGCHHSGAPNLPLAIESSCNTYFCRAFYNTITNKKYRNVREGYQAWKNHINKMGFGVKFNTDLPYEAKGIIPSVEYFDKKYKKKWGGNAIVSMGIGQGEVGSTPLQMANMIAIIANRGYYYKPHVVRAIGQKSNLVTRYSQKIESGIESRYFAGVIEGMRLAVNSGTGVSARIEGIDIAGKTGTAQNPHGADHSVFACFAPVHEPKIAIFVLVENAGWGSSVAAPIASLLVEYYLKREVKRKDLSAQMKALRLIRG